MLDKKIKMLVEYAESPLALGTRKPRFSWEVPLTGRSKEQSAYRIVVAAAPELLCPSLADLWDSGKVASSQSVNIEYAGQPLCSNMDCWWRVQVWDETGEPTGFGQAEYFGTALFEQSDWQAQWIGMGDPEEPFSDPDTFQQDRVAPEVAALEPDPRAPLLRRDFVVDKVVARARAYVSGLGLFELRLNGEKVGCDVLATPRTDFRKRVFYATYDVTSQLQEGANSLGLIIGNGWFNGQKKFWGWQMQWYGSPRAILQLEIEFEDGSTRRVTSDDSWQGSWSPITFNCIFDGENYDARMEQEGWDAPSFDCSQWQPVNLVSNPGGKLVAVDHEPNRVIKSWAPVSISEPRPGVFVFDTGTVMAGWVRLTIPKGKADETITLRYAELLHEDGMIDTSTANRARQKDAYTMKGTTDETYEPSFTYHGFRYVEISGFPGTPEANDITVCLVHNSVRSAGTFECGHHLIGKIHRCTLQSQRCNFQMGIPTDDTQRPERQGWGGDAWSYAQEAFYNFNVPRLFGKWIADFYDQQDDMGMVGMITPQAGPEEDLVWSAAFVLIPWWMYVHYGDRRILKESYPYLQRYIAYLKATGRREVRPMTQEEVSNALFWRCDKDERLPVEDEHGCLQIARWGDHLATNEGSSGFAKNQPLSIATAFYYYDVSIMGRIAEVLGRADDARRYRALAGKIKAAFNARFFDAANGYYDIGCQSAQAWPLTFGLVPEEHKDRVSGYLNSGVNFRQRRITSGYAGTKWLIRALSESGRNDIIWNRTVATDYPSWGYMLHGDKTTITENWHGSASQCHTTLGAAIDEWFYWGLAGIRPDPSAPGFKNIVFKPYLPPDLPWVRASLQTPRGKIVSSWVHDGTAAILTIKTPANSTAVVHIPVADGGTVMESGVPAADADDVSLIGTTKGNSVFAVGSGTYCFEFELGTSGG